MFLIRPTQAHFIVLIKLRWFKTQFWTKTTFEIESSEEDKVTRCACISRQLTANESSSWSISDSTCRESSLLPALICHHQTNTACSSLINHRRHHLFQNWSSPYKWTNCEPIGHKLRHRKDITITHMPKSDPTKIVSK